jgi:hypothetical protein
VQKRQLADHLPPAKDADQHLRRSLVDHLDASTADDEHPIGSFALANHPVARAHLDLRVLAGKALEQLVGQPLEHGQVAQDLGHPAAKPPS